MFDGCGNSHRSVKAAPDTLFSNGTSVYRNPAGFLLNENYDNNFIKSLLMRLQLIGCTVFQASSDADTLVVKSALVTAERGKPMYVVTNDTDILVLLLHL